MPARRRKYPYFKFQIYSETSLSWLENKATFASIEQLRDHLRKKKVSGKIKIIRADEGGYSDVGEPEILQT